MIKEKVQSILDLIKIKEGDNKRKVENLVVFLVILIITIIMINTIWNGENKKSKIDEIETDKVLAKTSSNVNNSINTIDNSTNLEERLKTILSKIEGVGKVEVLITYSESSKVTAMYNEDSTKNDTEESDTSRWQSKDKSNKCKKRNCLY